MRSYFCSGQPIAFCIIHVSESLDASGRKAIPDVSMSAGCGREAYFHSRPLSLSSKSVHLWPRTGRERFDLFGFFD